MSGAKSPGQLEVWSLIESFNSRVIGKSIWIGFHYLSFQAPAMQNHDLDDIQNKHLSHKSKGSEFLITNPDLLQ